MIVNMKVNETISINMDKNNTHAKELTLVIGKTDVTNSTLSVQHVQRIVLNFTTEVLDNQQKNKYMYMYKYLHNLVPHLSSGG